MCIRDRFYVITNIYLIRYALKIQKNPELSPMYELDKTSEFRDAADLDSFGKLDARKILIMLVFFASLILIEMCIRDSDKGLQEQACLHIGQRADHDADEQDVYKRQSPVSMVL